MPVLGDYQHFLGSRTVKSYIVHALKHGTASDGKKHWYYLSLWDAICSACNSVSLSDFK